VDLDGEVKSMLARGDAAGAATLVIRTLGGLVLGYLRPMLRDPDDVADAHSEWSERVWRGLPSFEFRSTLRTWAIRLAVNVGLNFRDQAYRRRVRRFDSGEASALAASLRTSSASLTRKRRELEELRRALTPGQQVLLMLRVDERLSWEEIAEILSESGDPVDAGTASKRFERLKAHLQKEARKRRLIG
jgi:RNA polymerase sigma-70 factor (ECF subfamily)